MLDSITANPHPVSDTEGARPFESSRRGRAGRAWLLAGPALLALGAGAFILYQREFISAHSPLQSSSAAAVKDPAPQPALAVATASAEVRPMERLIIGDGSVTAWQELVIGAEAGGVRVREVLAVEGDQVRRGQILVRLDDTVLAAQADQANAALAEAEAGFEAARLDLNRAMELSHGAIASRQSVEQRQAAARQAEARRVSARARRDEAAARLAQAQIIAPADGVVIRRSVQIGTVTSVGDEMFRLLRDGRLELGVKVPELDLGAVRPGQSVRVLHGTRRIRATVRAVAPTVAPETRLGIVHVALPPESSLLPGMFARAEILDTAQVLTIPRSALVFHQASAATFVVDENARASLRRLATGTHRDGLVEVVAGLRAGEQVVTAGAGFLSDGDHVRVVPRLLPSAAAPFARRDAHDADQPLAR